MKTNQLCSPIGLLLALAVSAQAQTPPTITRQPTNQVVSLGANVTFGVTASGTAPLTYQWRHVDAYIPWATTRLITITNAQTIHQGNYAVVVANSSGSVTSRVATLTVDPTFTKITTGPVVTDVESSSPGQWWDYDNDGWMDIFVPNAVVPEDLTTHSVYHNSGDGTFTKASNAITAPLRTITTASAIADFNNDGYDDLFIVEGSGNDSLFRNDGSGNFTPMSAVQAGALVGDRDDSSEAAWADYDRDGFIDIFVVNSWFRAANDALYRNNGNGSFTRMTTNQVGMLLGDGSLNGPCAWADYDSDGWPDLWVGRAMFEGPRTGRHSLYHNNGDGTFSAVRPGSLAQNVATGEGFWADYDNDGYLDLLLTGLFENVNSLHRNLAGQSFTNVAVSAGLTGAMGFWSAAWGDYDNDGHLDIFALANAASDHPTDRSVLYRNNGDGTFTSVDVGSPLRDGENRIGSGWADYDNDGFLDLLITCGDGAPKPNFLYRNNGNENHWLKLKLSGRASNRSAIGAKVRVHATIHGKSFWQMREISGNSGNGGGANGPVAHFGLGDATKADIVRIEWPSGNVQELKDATADQSLTIQEVVRITPTNPSASLNGSVTLTNATISGATYQWQFKGVSLANRTNRTLNLSNLQSSQQGDYSVVVKTAAATVTNHVYVLVDPSFTKITEGPLVTDLGSSFMAPVADYDGDGYQDVYVTRFDYPSKVAGATLYRNNRNGTFASVPNVPFANIGGEGYTAAWGDLDNDGRVDLIAANAGQPASLYLNQGSGQFMAAPPLEVREAESIALGDYDRDGLLDLYVTHWGYLSGSATNALYLNLGAGKFTRVSEQSAGAIVSVVTEFASWADYDDDGWPDLFTASWGLRRAWLFHNEGNGRFLPASNLVTSSTSPATIGAWGDYDNDGRLDLCTASLGGATELYHNLGSGSFERAPGFVGPTGNHIFAAWADYDNDGFLDLFVAGVPNPSHLYHNNGDGTFTRITAGSLVADIPLGGGKTIEFWDVASRTVSWFDYNNDGFLDLYAANTSDSQNVDTANFLYHNNGNANGWLKVKLAGTASNRDGAGAKVRVQAKYANQVRWQRRDITGGDIYNGQQYIAHFGLGDATNVITLRIEWPSGTMQEFQNVASKQFLTIWEAPALSAGILPDGACRLTITAEPNRSWRIQSSADLQTWTSLAQITNPNARFEYTDTTAAAAAHRFYRVTAE